MFPFDRLPALIQRNILEYAVQAALTPAKRLKFLSVCHVWRQLAAPAVFRIAFITDMSRDVLCIPIMVIDKSVCQEIYGTNMELVASTGSSRLVRDVIIASSTFSALKDLCDRIYSILDPKRNNWSGVRRLRVNFGVNLSSLFEPDGVLSHQSVDICNGMLFRLAATVAEILPNVKALHFFSILGDSCATKFFSVVANYYISRLAALSAFPSIFFFEPCFASRMTKLVITLCDLSAHLLPRLNPEILQELDLYNVRRSFSWLHFCDSHAKGQLRFSRLRTLSLTFDTGHLDALMPVPSAALRSQTMPVLFLCLKQLYVNKWPQGYSLFEKCIFPSRLQQLICIDAVDALRQIGSAGNIEFIHCMVIEVSLDQSHAGYFQVLNHYFGSSIKYDSCKLIDKHASFSLGSEAGIWHCLKHAWLSAAHYLVLLALICKTPSLHSLSVGYLILDRAYSDSQVFDMDEHLQTPADTLNTSMRSLRIYSFRDAAHEKDPNSARCIQHLVSRLVGLEELFIGMDIYEDLLGLLEGSRDDYPHTKNITISR